VSTPGTLVCPCVEGKGVTFVTDKIDSGVCHQAYFLDPDGNSLGIHHRYKPR